MIPKKKKSSGGNGTRVPTMTGRKGNIRGKRWSNRRARRLYLIGSDVEIERARYKADKLSLQKNNF